MEKAKLEFDSKGNKILLSFKRRESCQAREKEAKYGRNLTAALCCEASDNDTIQFDQTS